MHKHHTPLISQFFWLPGTPDFFGPRGAVWPMNLEERGAPVGLVRVRPAEELTPETKSAPFAH